MSTTYDVGDAIGRDPLEARKRHVAELPVPCTRATPLGDEGAAALLNLCTRWLLASVASTSPAASTDDADHVPELAGAALPTEPQCAREHTRAVELLDAAAGPVGDEQVARAADGNDGGSAQELAVGIAGQTHCER